MRVPGWGRANWKRPEDEVFVGLGESPTCAGYFDGGAVPRLEVDAVSAIFERCGAQVELTGGGGCAVRFKVELADGGGEHGGGAGEAGFVGCGGEPGIEIFRVERYVAIARKPNCFL